jgi:predicted GIY-YIG superfamily endonuclease
MAFITYIVKCADGSLYSGWTTDMDRRLDAHNSGKGARYTRGRTPVVLLAHWEFPSKQEAMSFEWHLKKLPRSQKLNLVQEQADHCRK